MKLSKKTKISILISIILLLLVTIVVVVLFLTNSNSALSIKSKAESGTTVALSFLPQTVNVSTGQEVSVDLKAQPAIDISIQGYHLRIGFDKTKIQITAIQYNISGISLTAGISDSNSTLSTVNQNGYMVLNGEVDSNQLPVLPASAPSSVATIKFVSLNGSSSGMNLITTDEHIFSQLGSDGLTLLAANATLATPLSINGTSTTLQTSTITTPTPTSITTSSVINTTSSDTLSTTAVINPTAVSTTTPVVTKLPNTGVFEDVIVTGIIGMVFISFGLIVMKKTNRK